MKRFKTARIAALILMGLFALNTAVLYTIFDINIFKPEKPSEAADTAENAGSNGIASGPGCNPGWTADKLGISSYSDDEELNQNSDGNKNKDDSINGREFPTPNIESKADDRHASEECFLTEEQVGGLENLKLQDKLSAVAMIARLGGEDTELVYEMARDGVTYGELEKIETILEKYLQPDEIEKLKAILEKSIKENE